MFGRRRRLGLRARVTVIYALGALLMSTLVAVSTFTLTQARLLDQAETAAREQAYENAMDLRRRLQSVPTELLVAAPISTTTVPDTQQHETTASTSTPPESTVPSSTAPTPTAIVPETTVPETTVPETTSPSSLGSSVLPSSSPPASFDPGSGEPTTSSTRPFLAVDIDDVRRAFGITGSTTPHAAGASTTPSTE
ncbi:MAG: hypothetical protein O3C27_13840, partial [Actinomycetota bacterium]|nr:hypothetical protein [Actinomycetota bacterium]